MAGGTDENVEAVCSWVDADRATKVGAPRSDCVEGEVLVLGEVVEVLGQLSSTGRVRELQELLELLVGLEQVRAREALDRLDWPYALTAQLLFEGLHSVARRVARTVSGSRPPPDL